jgi:hypothetical protein
LEEKANTHAPSYAGKASSPDATEIPWLTMFACADGDVDLHVVVAPTARDAQAMVENATPQNQCCAAFSLEPEIFAGMKEFLRDRRPVNIKIM